MKKLENILSEIIIAHKKNILPQAEVAQPGTARAWRARGALHLGSSNLPLGVLLSRLVTKDKRRV